MNIESTNLLSSVVSNGTNESVSPAVVAGSAGAEGFSGELVTQIELLNNIKAGSAVLSSQTPGLVGGQTVNSSQDVAGVPTVNIEPQNVAGVPTVNIEPQNVAGVPTVNIEPQNVAGVPTVKIELQNVAASIGNNLPLTYKTKDDVDHEATLAAVNDTLKYIAANTNAGEKMVGIGQQNTGNAAVMAVPAEQSVADIVAMVAPVKQDVKAPVSVAASQTRQDMQGVAVKTEQDMTGIVVIDAPAQMTLTQANGKPDTKKTEGDAQIANADNSGVDSLLASMVLPTVMPVEQGKTVNNLTPVPADAVKDAPLSFIGASAGDAKLNLSTKGSGDMMPGEVVLRQSLQEQQDFSLKYIEDYNQTEKNGRIEQQALNVDGGKALSAGGVDAAAQLNRPAAENKADVPAITKPLSHPEWNKDLGDRVVWMSNKSIPSAEIRLNPQHLGPISVRVNVTDDQASVVFTAQHAAVRETLEASIPKLREMMSAQNLNLADVNVSQGPTSDQGRSQSQNSAQSFADGQRQGAEAAVDGLDDVEQEIESGRAVVSKGLLSIYA